MEEIDLILQERGILIPHRQIEAVGIASEKLGCSLALTDPNVTPRPGDFVGEQFTSHLYHWFKARYGDKLKISLSPGRMAFSLRGDLWVFDFAKVYGKVELLCSATEQSHHHKPLGSGKPRFNMLDSITGLSGDFRASLSSYEVEEIGYLFVLGYSAVTRMEAISNWNLRFLSEAKSDLEAAVHFLTANQHFGQSKWASLQATEKMMKAFIVHNNGTFETTHGLEEGAIAAEYLGLPRIPRQHLALIQCKGGVRYGDISVDCTDALVAHHASLAVSGQVALSIMRKNGITDDTVSSLVVTRIS